MINNKKNNQNSSFSSKKQYSSAITANNNTSVKIKCKTGFFINIIKNAGNPKFAPEPYLL